MIKLTDSHIKEIAENLETGMCCYFNKQTGEIKIIPDFDNWLEPDEEPWEDDIKEINDNRDLYIQFECMESSDAFDLMANFTETVDDQKLREKLMNALNNRKPFQNFNWEINHSGEYRQKWFDFKSKGHLDWVRNQIL